MQATNEDKYKKLANEALAFSERVLAKPLDYSEKSIATVETLLKSLVNNKHMLKDENHKRGIASIWGSYIGEVILKNLNGNWLENGDLLVKNNDLNVEVQINPIDKVSKYIDNGETDGLVSYYEILKEFYYNRIPRTSEKREDGRPNIITHTIAKQPQFESKPIELKKSFVLKSFIKRFLKRNITAPLVLAIILGILIATRMIGDKNNEINNNTKLEEIRKNNQEVEDYERSIIEKMNQQFN